MTLLGFASSTKPLIHAQKLGFTEDSPLDPGPHAVGVLVVKITFVGDDVVDETEFEGAKVPMIGAVGAVVVGNDGAGVVARAARPKKPQPQPPRDAESLQPHFPTHASAIEIEAQVATGRRQKGLSGCCPSHPKHVLHWIGQANLAPVSEQSNGPELQVTGSSTLQPHTLAPVTNTEELHPQPTKMSLAGLTGAN